MNLGILLDLQSPKYEVHLFFSPKQRIVTLLDPHQSAWHQLNDEEEEEKTTRCGITLAPNLTSFQIVRGGTVPFYPQKGSSRDLRLENVRGEVKLAAFGAVSATVNGTLKLLMIQKKRSGLRYIPGGLVDRKDAVKCLEIEIILGSKTLTEKEYVWMVIQEAAKREVKEETGVVINHGAFMSKEPAFLYNSFAGHRNNVMAVFPAHLGEFQEDPPLQPEDTKEIERAFWIPVDDLEQRIKDGQDKESLLHSINAVRAFVSNL